MTITLLSLPIYKYILIILYNKHVIWNNNDVYSIVVYVIILQFGHICYWSEVNLNIEVQVPFLEIASFQQIVCFQILAKFCFCHRLCYRHFGPMPMDSLSTCLYFVGVVLFSSSLHQMHFIHLFFKLKCIALFLLEDESGNVAFEQQVITELSVGQMDDLSSIAMKCFEIYVEKL